MFRSSCTELRALLKRHTIGSSTRMTTSLSSSFPAAPAVLTQPSPLPPPRPSFASVSVMSFFPRSLSPPPPNPVKSADGDRGLEVGEDGEEGSAVEGGRVLDGCTEEAAVVIEDTGGGGGDA